MHGWLGWVAGWIGSGIKKMGGKTVTMWKIDLEQSLDGGVLLMRKADLIKGCKGKTSKRETDLNTLLGV